MRAISHTFAQLRVTDFRLETLIWIIELDQGWKFLTEKVDLIHYSDFSTSFLTEVV